MDHRYLVKKLINLMAIRYKTLEHRVFYNLQLQWKINIGIKYLLRFGDTIICNRCKKKIESVLISDPMTIIGFFQSKRYPSQQKTPNLHLCNFALPERCFR